MFQELTDPAGPARVKLQDLEQVLSASGKLKEDVLVSLLAITGWQNAHDRPSALVRSTSLTYAPFGCYIASQQVCKPRDMLAENYHSL